MHVPCTLVNIESVNLNTIFKLQYMYAAAGFLLIL